MGSVFAVSTRLNVLSETLSTSEQSQSCKRFDLFNPRCSLVLLAQTLTLMFLTTLLKGENPRSKLNFLAEDVCQNVSVVGPVTVSRGNPSPTRGSGATFGTSHA